MLQAPEAMTSVLHDQTPPSVRTKYPVSLRHTDFTVVWVRTGAAIECA